MIRSKSGENQRYNFTLKTTLIGVDCDMSRICTKKPVNIESLDLQWFSTAMLWVVGQGSTY